MLHSFFVAVVDAVGHQLHIAHPYHNVGRHKIEHALPAFFEEMGLYVGDKTEVVDGFYAELALGVEGADAFYLIAKQLNAVREVVGKAKYVDDAAADAELAGLVHKIFALKAVFDQHLG